MARQKSAEEQIVDLQTQLAESNKKVEELTAKVAEVSKPASEVEAGLKEEVETYKGLLAELQKNYDELSAATKGAKLNPVVTVDGKKYEVAIKGNVSFKGEKITADMVKESDELAAALVAKGVGFMIPIEA